MAQVADGGPAALSLSGIARRMGFSGPAIYRYFPGREALLARLVADVFASLVEALRAAPAEGTEPEARFRAVARAYRAWAITHPREYALITARVRDPVARRDMLAATDRARDLLIAAAAGFGGPPAWARTFSVVVWQRLHGHLTLELEGLHEAMGIESAPLYESELDALVGQAQAAAAADALSAV